MVRLCIRSIVLGLLVVAGLIVGCATKPPASHEPGGVGIERPIVKVGDSWTYRKIDGLTKKELSVSETRVVNVNERAIQTATAFRGALRDVDAIWTPEWNSVASPDSEIFEPHDGSFTFPLQPGSYALSYDFRRPASDTRLSFEGTARVLGWEDVHVPAGLFRVLRIQINLKAARRGPFPGYVSVNKTVWYSPAVKRWVKLAHQQQTFGAEPGMGIDNWILELLDYKTK